MWGLRQRHPSLPKVRWSPENGYLSAEGKMGPSAPSKGLARVPPVATRASTVTTGPGAQQQPVHTGHPQRSRSWLDTTTPASTAENQTHEISYEQILPLCMRN